MVTSLEEELKKKCFQLFDQYLLGGQIIGKCLVLADISSCNKMFKVPLYSVHYAEHFRLKVI